MRTIITLLFIGIISVGTLFAEEQVTEKKNENNMSVGGSYLFGRENDDSFVNIDLQMFENYKSLIMGLDVVFGIPLVKAAPDGFVAFRPSIGFYAHGNQNSKFSIMAKTSTGIAALSVSNSDNKSHFGTMSELSIIFVYNNIGLDVSGWALNIPIYYNNYGGKIGIKSFF